ncbi:hypothetical protein E2320_017430 [Naja naja]|nr:hypothetical protein E2320_017430 [Naja naja]
MTENAGELSAGYTFLCILLECCTGTDLNIIQFWLIPKKSWYGLCQYHYKAQLSGENGWGTGEEAISPPPTAGQSCAKSQPPLAPSFTDSGLAKGNVAQPAIKLDWEGEHEYGNPIFFSENFKKDIVKYYLYFFRYPDSNHPREKKKTCQHKKLGICPSDKGVAGWMWFYTWCPEGLQKPGLGVPDRHVMGGRGRVLGWDCKEDTWELAGFMREAKVAAVAEGGFSSPFVEASLGATSSLPALPPVPIGSSVLLNGVLFWLPHFGDRCRQRSSGLCRWSNVGTLGMSHLPPTPMSARCNNVVLPFAQELGQAICKIISLEEHLTNSKILVKQNISWQKHYSNTVFQAVLKNIIPYYGQEIHCDNNDDHHHDYDYDDNDDDDDHHHHHLRVLQDQVNPGSSESNNELNVPNIDSYMYVPLKKRIKEFDTAYIIEQLLGGIGIDVAVTPSTERTNLLVCQFQLRVFIHSPFPASCNAASRNCSYLSPDHELVQGPSVVQVVQNGTAILLHGTLGEAHITPLLKQLSEVQHHLYLDETFANQPNTCLSLKSNDLYTFEKEQSQFVSAQLQKKFAGREFCTHMQLEERVKALNQQRPTFRSYQASCQVKFLKKETEAANTLIDTNLRQNFHCWLSVKQKETRPKYKRVLFFFFAGSKPFNSFKNSGGQAENTNELSKIDMIAIPAETLSLKKLPVLRSIVSETHTDTSVNRKVSTVSYSQMSKYFFSAKVSVSDRSHLQEDVFAHSTEQRQFDSQECLFIQRNRVQHCSNSNTQIPWLQLKSMKELRKNLCLVG